MAGGRPAPIDPNRSTRIRPRVDKEESAPIIRNPTETANESCLLFRLSSYVAAV
jgi:hypothetical protein